MRPPKRHFVIWLVVTAAVAGFCGYFAVDSFATVGHYLWARQHYRATEGTVVSRGVRAVGDGDAEPVIGYHYTVERRIYFSYRLTFGRSSLRFTPQEAQVEIDKYSVDQTVTVYYDPQDASRSVLLMGLPARRWWYAAAMIPFLVLGVVMIIQTIRIGRSAFRGKDESQAPAESGPDAAANST